jgi:hypothetical protein
MDTLVPLTLVLARAYGVAITAVALSAILAPARMQSALGDFQRNPGLTFISALFAVVLGLFLVIIHSIWHDAPAVLVSLLGWVILIKGIVLLAATDGLMKIAAAITASSGIVRTWGVFALVLGIAYLVIGLMGRALAGL